MTNTKQESFTYEDFQYLRMILDGFNTFLYQYRSYKPQDENQDFDAISLSVDKWLQYAEHEIRKRMI